MTLSHYMKSQDSTVKYSHLIYDLLKYTVYVEKNKIINPIDVLF